MQKLMLITGVGTAYPSGEPPVSSGVRVTRSLIYVYVLYIVVCLFVMFRLVIVLSVLLQFTNYDYPLVYSW